MSVETKLPSGQAMIWKQIEYPTFYSNLMAFAMSALDISLIFGEIGESTATEVSGTPRVKIILTPEQASNLQKILTVAMEAYVSNNGPLRTSGAVDMAQLAEQMEKQKVKLQ